MSQSQDFPFLRLIHLFILSESVSSLTQHNTGLDMSEESWVMRTGNHLMKPCLQPCLCYLGWRMVYRELGCSIWPPVYLGLRIWHLYGAFGIKNGLFGIWGRVLSKYLILPDTLSFCRYARFLQGSM